jgi:FkbM family methyltransferase
LSTVVKIFGGHLVNKTVLKKYPVVINAGVHNGEEMLDLMGIVSDLKIYALEPSEKCYNKTLQKFNSYENIKFIKKALVARHRNGKVQFTDFMINGRHYSYGGLQDLTKMQHGNETYDVEVINMKELIDSIDLDIGLFKADIEGSEYEVIMDFDENIASKIKQIAIEIQDLPDKSCQKCKVDITNKLEELGYDVYTHVEGNFDTDIETEIINGIPFSMGGIYAVRKDK